MSVTSSTFSSAPVKAANDLVIRFLTPAIALFNIPFARFGILPIGNRSVALKLKNNDVFLMVSSPCDEPTTKVLDEMGPVKYLLTPDFVHANNIVAFSKRYPDAKCIGPEGIDTKRPEVQWAGVMGQGGESKQYGFEEEIALHYFPGHVNKEIAVLHKPSRSLIVADLLFNLPAKEQYSNTKTSPKAFWPLSIVGDKWHPGTGLHEMLIKGVGKDKAAMIRDAKVVADWDFDRIIPCHGDVIDTEGKKAWLDVMAPYLKQ